MACCDAIVKYKYPNHKLILGTLNVEVPYEALDTEDKTALLVSIKKNLEDALANKDVAIPSRIAKKFFTVQKRTPLRLRTVVETGIAVKEVLAEYIPKRPFVLLADAAGYSIAFVREMKSGPAFIPICHCEPCCCDKKVGPKPQEPHERKKEEPAVVAPVEPSTDIVPVMDKKPVSPSPTVPTDIPVPSVTPADPAPEPKIEVVVVSEPQHVRPRSAEATEEGKKAGEEKADSGEKKGEEEGLKVKEKTKEEKKDTTEEAPKLPYKALRPVATKYHK